MPRPLLAALAATLLLSVGCLSTEPQATTLSFDLTQAGLGGSWEAGSADYPVGRETDIAPEIDRRPIPASIGNASALYQSGTNVTGDLFLFHKKYWSGLPSNRTFQASLYVEFISNVHAGCTTGIGPSVLIKAGVSAYEPLVSPDAQNIYRVRLPPPLDKGTGPSGGDFAQLGDIRNGLTGCPASGTYAVHGSNTVRQAVNLTTDDLGGFWMFIGTQSSFQARHAIYIVGVRLVLRAP